jgi:hypothetical protein
MSTVAEPLEIVRSNVDTQEIALQYVRHEFIKLFPEQSEAFYEQLADGVARLPKHLGDHLFWELVAGLAEGYKYKWIYRILTDDGLVWRLEKIRLNDIHMTGMSQFMDPILREANWQPAEFAKVWNAHPEYAQQPRAAGIKPEPLRDDLPIMLVERQGALKVFDGMRRTCMAALAGKSEMTAWVGRRVKPGKGKLSPDKLLFLFATYSEAGEQDAPTLEALATISRMVVREHTNGEQAVERALQLWDGQQHMKDAAAAIRAAIR